MHVYHCRHIRKRGAILKAWLTHVSTEYADEVNGMIAKLDENNHGKAYVAIGGKKGSLKAMRGLSRMSSAVHLSRRREWRSAAPEVAGTNLRLRLSLPGQEQRTPGLFPHR
jgi:hypothetical protein